MIKTFVPIESHLVLIVLVNSGIRMDHYTVGGLFNLTTGGQCAWIFLKMESAK